LKKVEIQNPENQNWLPVANPNRTVNLLKDGTQGTPKQLEQQAALPKRHFRKMRIIVGDSCNLRLLDGTVQKLEVPNVMQHGLIVDVDLDLKAATTAQILVDVDVSRSVQIIKDQGQDTYHLLPLVQIYTQTYLGSIQGVLKEKTTGQVLAGA